MFDYKTHLVAVDPFLSDLLCPAFQPADHALCLHLCRLPLCLLTMRAAFMYTNYTITILLTALTPNS